MAYDLSAFRHPRLRATDQKYRESDDRSKIKFSYYYFSKICWQFFSELFPKITSLRSAFLVFPILQKLKSRQKARFGSAWNMQKFSISSKLLQATLETALVLQITSRLNHFLDTYTCFHLL